VASSPPPVDRWDTVDRYDSLGTPHETDEDTTVASSVDSPLLLCSGKETRSHHTDTLHTLD
jgi:hypothetical protein